MPTWPAVSESHTPGSRGTHRGGLAAWGGQYQEEPWGEPKNSPFEHFNDKVNIENQELGSPGMKQLMLSNDHKCERKENAAVSSFGVAPTQSGGQVCCVLCMRPWASHLILPLELYSNS